MKKAATTSFVLELDEEVKQLFQRAAQRGDYVIGVVT